MKILMIISVLISLSCFAGSATFPPDFIFGVASAPGHVEDKLPDIWLTWGQRGRIKGWSTNPNPGDRIKFWTQPEVELDLAQKLGIQSFRLGVDWGRIMPEANRFDEEAIRHYKNILLQARKRKLRIMLTLMHHSVPSWIQDLGGWHNEKTKDHFLRFSKRVIKEFHSEVDWWISFNEPNVFVTNAYSAGFWPPGDPQGLPSLFSFGPFQGSSIQAMDLMSETHRELYDWAHQHYPQIKLGLAHNMAHYTSRSFFGKLIASYIDGLFNWRFPEKVAGKLDFFGFNYYGSEWLTLGGLEINPEEEYSDSGRAIDVNGFSELLLTIHQKYPTLPIIITENGIADEKDALRGSYLLEHLRAISKAILAGVPVKGYYFWTLTDNLEWSDGYCPKFGLVAIDRNSFKRSPRKSFDLYREIIEKKEISEELRNREWQKVKNLQGSDRLFCRHDDGVTALDEAITKKFSSKDWRLK
jgi:galactolipid galactosyltransferase